MRGIRWWLAGVVALLIAAPAGAAPKWLRVVTPHFVIVGDARESELRSVGARLEQFREVLILAAPGGNAHAPVPTVVVVFTTDESARPFMPMAGTAGWFQPGRDVHYIGLSLQAAFDAWPIIYHEFVHAALANSMAWVPPWFGEGLAQFYETFEMSRDGLEARLGQASGRRVLLLREKSMVPFAEMFGLETPLARHADRVDVLYAQAWAVVHYLQLGSPERKGQLSDYITRVAQGAPSTDAARAAFHCEVTQLQGEVSRYAQENRFGAVKLRLSTPVERVAVGPAERLGEDVASAYLGDMLARQGRADLALQLLDAALRSGPVSARVQDAIGVAHLVAARRELAVAAFRAAVTIDPRDGLAQYHLGRSLGAGIGADASGEAAGADARGPLERAVALLPNHPDANALLGQLILASAGDPAEARPYIERAVRLMPANEQYRLTLARLLVAEHRLPLARQVLGRLAVASHDPGIKAAARAELSRAAAIELAPPPKE